MVSITNPPPALRATASAEDCAVDKALAVVGAKWTLIVLHHLMDGPKRFGDLQRLVPAASPKMLTVRLRELERLGLLTRTVHAEIPPRRLPAHDAGQEPPADHRLDREMGSQPPSRTAFGLAVRRTVRIISVAALAVGVIWIFQGIGALPGSFMTGRSEWAVAGAALAAGAAVVLWLARSAPPDRLR